MNRPVRIYIAAPWVRRPEAIAIGEQFKAAGYELTSRWFHHKSSSGDPQDATGSSSPINEIRQQAQEDIHDVQRADALVVLNLEKSEGKAVETGVALMTHIPVISVGKRSNIFQSLGVEVATVEAAIDALRILFP